VIAGICPRLGIRSASGAFKSAVLVRRVGCVRQRQAPATQRRVRRLTMAAARDAA
jgi:hypothetical protein